MKLTIIIPTLNRSNFLNKLLEYYSNLNFKAVFLILDSSEGNEKKKNINILSRYKELNIKYINIKGKPLEVIRKSKRNIQTKYCVFSGDDDFFVKKSLAKIIKFLDNKKNNKFIGGSGIGLLFSKYNNNLNTVEYQSLFKSNSNNAIERLKDISSDYCVSHFSICRSKYFIKALEVVDKKKIPHRAFYDEIAFSITLALYGKFYQFKTFFIAREISHQRNNLWKNSNKKLEEISINYLLEYWKKIINSIDGEKYSKNEKYEHVKNLLKQNFEYDNKTKRQIINKLLNFYNSKIYFSLYNNFILKILFTPIEILRNLFNPYSFQNLLKQKIFKKDLNIIFKIINK